MSTQERNSALSSIIQPDMFRAGLWSEVIAGFQALPGLVGFWPMSSVQRSTGNAYDLSGQGRHLTSVLHGSNYHYTGLVPYCAFNGVDDYLYRADETDLDILGSEAIFASETRGLTMGGWFWVDTLSASSGLMGKWTDTTQRSYVLVSTTTSTFFDISTDGSAQIVVSTGQLLTSQWYFLAARFVPSTSIDLFVYNIKVPNTTSIPATIFNSSAAFEIGAYSGAGNYIDGRASLCFLCANALSDSIISGIYQRSRLLFNV